MDLMNDVRLYKVDVVIEDDFSRICNLQRVLYNETANKTFNNFVEWKNNFYKLYCNYKRDRKIEKKKGIIKDDYLIFMQSFYFKHNIFNNKIDLFKQIRQVIKDSKKMMLTNFKF
jgi:hypothetical protein